MEEIQDAMSGLNLVLLSDDYSKQVRADILRASLGLEDMLSQLTTRLHSIYHTHKQPHQKRFNPLTDGLVPDVGFEWSDAEAVLITEIRRLMAAHGKSFILQLSNLRAKY
jgi:hypothetical protein